MFVNIASQPCHFTVLSYLGHEYFVNFPYKTLLNVLTDFTNNLSKLLSQQSTFLIDDSQNLRLQILFRGETFSFIKLNFGIFMFKICSKLIG